MGITQRISARQYAFVVFLFVVGDAMLYVPSWLASEAKQDAWLGAVLGWPEALLLAWLYMALTKRYPEATLVRLCRSVFGSWLGTAAGALFVSYFFVDTALMTMEIGDFLTTQIIPRTPIESIILLFLIAMVVGVRYGIETIVRLCELLLPWFIVLFATLLLFVWPQLDVANIRPVAGEGLLPIWTGNMKYFGVLMETVILVSLLPFVDRRDQAGKALLTGMLAGIAVLALLTAFAVLVIGPALAAMYAYPSYALAQKIRVGHFFERIEAVMAFAWFITVYVKTTVGFFATAYGLAELLKLKQYRPIVWPLAMIVFNMAIVFVPNRQYFDVFASRMWTPYSMTFGLFLPLLLFAAGKLRRRR
ncbi:GerAB/ArcD/ProY family transporter [Paenibacillus flagellatus]|uniref:Spore gernimation protein n=1 Tax=Paenibacillus flagellatus TaxID=2211139 RepID=A0A2V5KYE3_9BACL|nr:endospore germination permease [Paenibacillus flagellatus]PYI54946.1 spore gernimation protein [Paenibacillus flagellatus]